MSNLIAIKGSKDGLRLQLDESRQLAGASGSAPRAAWPGGELFSWRADHGRHRRACAERRSSSRRCSTLMQQHGVRPESLASTARESRNAARAAGMSRAAADANRRERGTWRCRHYRSAHGSLRPDRAPPWPCHGAGRCQRRRRDYRRRQCDRLGAAARHGARRRARRSRRDDWRAGAGANPAADRRSDCSLARGPRRTGSPRWLVSNTTRSTSRRGMTYKR